jgi:hypothetical protein
MPGQLPVNNILYPGAVSLPLVNRQLVSMLQLLTPQAYSKYTRKFGNEDFTWWLSTFGGMERVKNRDFFWFESRGKLMVGITVKTAISAPAAGATVTVALAVEDHYDSGTLSPLRVGETVRIASSNIEGKILTVDDTTPNLFTFTVRPLQSTQAFVSAGSLNLLANEILIFGGDTEAGEASDSIDPLVAPDERYENSITEIRDSWAATDLAEMTEIWYDLPSGSGPNGVSQAGTSVYTLKGLHDTNLRFKNNVEFKLMRGDIQNNTGLTNSVGTQGLIPQIIERGQTVTYTPGNLDLAKIHEITRVMDVNGAVPEFMWMQDVNQRQDFSDSLFTQFPAGAWVWVKTKIQKKRT